MIDLVLAALEQPGDGATIVYGIVIFLLIIVGLIIIIQTASNQNAPAASEQSRFVREREPGPIRPVSANMKLKDFIEEQD